MEGIENIQQGNQAATDEQVENQEVDTNEVAENQEEGSEGEQGGENTPTMYTQEQVESAVKTRVSTFNKKIERMKPYETAVKKISSLTGMDVNTLVSRLESMSDADQAKVLGITPAQLQAQRANREANSRIQEQNMKLQRELEEQKLSSDPAFHDYPLFKEEINDLLEDNPKLTMKQAYMLVKGETGIKAAQRDAEQRAVARMTKSSNQSVVKSGNSKPNNSPKLSPTTIQAAKEVGMDPAEYAAFSNISSMEEYEKLMANKK